MIFWGYCPGGCPGKYPKKKSQLHGSFGVTTITFRVWYLYYLVKLQHHIIRNSIFFLFCIKT
jgi:hypothetical protein